MFSLKIYITLGSLLLLASQASVAEPLTLTPSKCVTLKQGNICYQQVKITWKNASASDFCLFAEMSKPAIKCWENQQQGAYEFEFKKAASIDYHLVQMPEKKIITAKRFSVKWVYKKRPNHSWRLF